MNVLSLFDYTIVFLKENNIRHEYMSFPSGATILDVWYRDKFYVFQYNSNSIGVSEVDENVGFDSYPDRTILSNEKFKDYLKSIFLDSNWT